MKNSWNLLRSRRTILILATMLCANQFIFGREDIANSNRSNCQNLYEDLIRYNEHRKTIKPNTISLNQFFEILWKSKEMDCPQSEAFALESIGSHYFGISQLDKALNFLNLSQRKYAKLGASSAVVRINNKTGIIYTQMGLYSKALNCFLTAKSELQEKGLSKSPQMAELLTNLATLYEVRNDMNESLALLYKALWLFKKNGKIFSLSDVYNNLGMLYFNKLNEPKKALYFFEMAHKIKKKYFLANLAITTYNIGYLSMVQFQDYKKAQAYFQQTLNVGVMKKNQYYIGISKQGLGEIALAKHEYKKSEHYFLEAIEVEKKAKILAELNISYESLSRLYEKLLDYKKSLHFYKLNEQLRSQISSTAASKEFVRLKTKYSFLEKDKKIELLHRDKLISELKIKRERNYFYFGFSILFISLGSLWMWSRKENQRKRLSLEKRIAITGMKALNAQINSHFIANTLVSIKNFLFRKDTDKTFGLIDKFSLLMRNTLIFSRQELISLEEDIDVLRTYLDLERVNHSNKFDYEIIIGDSLSQGAIQIPPMLVQPFIENSIKHGIHSEEFGKITILYSLTDGSKLLIRIIDNGKGIELSKEMPLKLGEGTKIIMERLAIFNTDRLNHAKLAFSNASEKGTIVDLLIPIE